MIGLNISILHRLLSSGAFKLPHWEKWNQQESLFHHSWWKYSIKARLNIHGRWTWKKQRNFGMIGLKGSHIFSSLWGFQKYWLPPRRKEWIKNLLLLKCKENLNLQFCMESDIQFKRMIIKEQLEWYTSSWKILGFQQLYPKLPRNNLMGLQTSIPTWTPIDVLHQIFYPI